MVECTSFPSRVSSPSLSRRITILNLGWTAISPLISSAWIALPIAFAIFGPVLVDWERDCWNHESVVGCLCIRHCGIAELAAASHICQIASASSLESILCCFNCTKASSNGGQFVLVLLHYSKLSKSSRSSQIFTILAVRAQPCRLGRMSCFETSRSRIDVDHSGEGNIL